MNDILASPLSSPPREPESVRQSDIALRGYPSDIRLQVPTNPTFTGGWFICSTCQASYCIDHVDIAYFEKMGGDIRTGFIAACMNCSKQANGSGFQIFAHLTRSTGLKYWVRKMALKILFGVQFQGGPRPVVVSRTGAKA